MNEKGLKTLEYDKIIHMLLPMAGGEATREKISKLVPATDLRRIKEALEETEEAVELIKFKGAMPIGNFYDIKGLVSLCQKGAGLSMGQLLKVAYNLKTASMIKSFMKGDMPSLPILQGMVEILCDFKDLAEVISSSIDSEFEMNSRASHDLGRIRRQIDKKNEDIRTKINNIIKKAGSNAMLQDTIVTIREDRFVIPVKQEYRSAFPGIIHDKSSSGATLFIEPQSVVNLNNEIKELHAEEQAEINRILEELSSRVGEHGEEIKNDQQLLVELDFIMAKGKFAASYEGEMPEILQDGEIRLKNARHPLIPAEKVVPINLFLGSKASTMVITGPNTGGKTVTLKTLGLLSLMAQSGLFIPADGGSVLPYFADVYADIGDEQSIEQSLSTFSSHMTNLVEICIKANHESLVLLDELGAGTDPTEGAALAIAILEELASKGSRIMATTHYTELKKYAISKEGVENASMEFDVESLSPTYKLILGMPGKSNAFEISKKLGISEHIIDRAKSLLDLGAIEFEDVIAAISEEKRAAEEERDEAISLNLAMKDAKEKAEKQLARAEKDANRIIEKSREDAKLIIEEARQTAHEVKEKLKKIQKMESLGERNKAMAENKKALDKASSKLVKGFEIPESFEPIKKEQIKVGVRVRVVTIGQKGVITALPDSRGDIIVQVGNLKMKCKASSLELVIDGSTDPVSKGNKAMNKKVERGGASYGSIYRTKAQNISRSINVRGQTLEEAVDNVLKYLDDAIIAGIYEVRIIHGRGEGILRSAIRQELKKHRQVAEFHRANYDEGGDGVTVVKLKH